MVRRKLVLAILLTGTAAPGLHADVRHALSDGAATSRLAAQSPDDDGAYRLAAGSFGEGARDSVLSPPLLVAPEGGTVEKNGYQLVVGDPDSEIDDKEPPNPLTKEEKAKPQKSGKEAWWGLGGALAGAGLGFLLGGPIGAAVGGLIGAVAGYFFGP